MRGPDRHCSQWIAIAVGIVLLLARAIAAEAQQVSIDISPGDPTNSELISIEVSGVANSPCILPAEAGPGLGCPNGDAVVFVTAEFAGTQLTCLSAAPERFQPLHRDVGLPGALASTRLADFFTYRWGGTEPAGRYTFFVVMTPTGALGDGRIDPDDLLTIGSRMLTFAP